MKPRTRVHFYVERKGGVSPGGSHVNRYLVNWPFGDTGFLGAYDSPEIERLSPPRVPPGERASAMCHAEQDE